jgi:hypothetical protein
METPSSTRVAGPFQVFSRSGSDAIAVALATGSAGTAAPEPMRHRCVTGRVISMRPLSDQPICVARRRIW